MHDGIEKLWRKVQKYTLVRWGEGGRSRPEAQMSHSLREGQTLPLAEERGEVRHQFPE